MKKFERVIYNGYIPDYIDDLDRSLMRDLLVVRNLYTIHDISSDRQYYKIDEFWYPKESFDPHIYNCREHFKNKYKLR